MSLEQDARRLVVDGELAALDARNRLEQKAALQPAYGLYLKELSRGREPLVRRAEDYLRVITAMRDEHRFADLAEVPESEPPSIERLAASPLHVLAAYLERLPGSAVLVIETGARALTFFALRGGREPLEARIVLERASKDCVAAILALMQRQDADIARIGQREPITEDFFAPIEAAGAATWAALPAAVRTILVEARSVLYLPSAFGDLSVFPLELLRAEDGWLGATRSIARLSSLRTLFELLSPNRMPSRLAAQALVVRAQDSEELTAADAEATAVCEELKILGLAVDVDRAPRVKTIRAALDRGLRVMHYCGHGVAGNLGEALPLAEGELLGSHDFSQLSGWGTPFVYLSTCEVGRARMTTTGSAAGIATRLIEKGAPGVVGCLQSVPDLVARTMACAFYKAAATRPLGEALVVARGERLRFPPACWGAFVYFGDPDLRLTGTDAAVPQARARTRRWDTLVGRHVALRSPASRQRALDAVAAALADPTPTAEPLDQIAGWLASSFQAEEPSVAEARRELCRAVAAVDAVAGCELRMLLAMETLHGSYYGPRKPDLVLNPEELAIGLSLAGAIHDMLAWAAFAIEGARSSGIAYDALTRRRMLDEAEGVLEGWRLEEPAAADLLAAIGALKGTLRDRLTSS